jgi:RND family efflux transporter MFP subunit
VLVVPGDRVKKGQPLVKLDDDEPQADVRAKKAILENARTTHEEAKEVWSRLTKASSEGGVVSGQQLLEKRTLVIKTEREERAAKAALEAAQAELEHYTVAAPIDGVIAWLDVHPGMVSRPGTTVWGEILNLAEVDVRCEVTPEQADGLAVGQVAEIRMDKRQEVFGTGRVVFVGILADKATGLVPVLVRVANPKERLRCEIAVQVRFCSSLATGK